MEPTCFTKICMRPQAPWAKRYWVFQIYSSLVGCHCMTQLELGKILNDGFFDSRSNLIPPIRGYQELFNRPQCWKLCGLFFRGWHTGTSQSRDCEMLGTCVSCLSCRKPALVTPWWGVLLDDHPPDLNFNNNHPKNRFRSCMNGVYVTPVTTTTPWMGLQHPSNEGGHFIRKHVLIVHLSLLQDISSFGYVKCHLFG